MSCCTIECSREICRGRRRKGAKKEKKITHTTQLTNKIFIYSLKIYSVIPRQCSTLDFNSQSFRFPSLFFVSCQPGSYLSLCEFDSWLTTKMIKPLNGKKKNIIILEYALGLITSLRWFLIKMCQSELTERMSRAFTQPPTLQRACRSHTNRSVTTSC